MRKIGRYQITRELGRGAMGVVYHAIDPTIGRALAIKTLRLRDLDDGEQRRRLRERLFREARSAGALSHPGIVTIYDMDEVDGLAYIAMEFVDGETLEEILVRQPGISRERLVEVLRQAAAALDFAHRKGIIHRDIKPANIMIDSSGAVKITDFGIAKITELEGQTLTGVLIGTPNYMSPEQVQGNEIDGRSDQFSLGVIAYEMLSGERPFYGEQISTVVYKIVADQPVPIQNINTTLNEAIDKVLRRSLAKRPEKRYASCTALVTALDGALENIKGWRVLPRKAHQNVATANTDALTRTVKPSRKRSKPPEVSAEIPLAPKRTPWLLPFLGAFLFLLAILAAVAWQTGLLDHSASARRNDSETGREGTSPPPTTTSAPPSSNAAKSEEDRQSPMPEAPPPSDSSGEQSKATVTPPSTPDRPSNAPETSSALYEIQVASDPAGAAMTLDGANDTVCQTPCALRAHPGVHTVTITRDGYGAESREVRVDHDNVDVGLIALRSANGMLLLTSDPSGAHVWLDGKPTDFVTPVRVSLSAGSHRVAIQKDGLQSSDQVEIRNGVMSTLKLTVKRQ